MQSLFSGIRKQSQKTRTAFIFKRAGNQSTAPRRALGWVRDNELPSGGIKVHHTHRNAYPEVSGYLIPTLLAVGEKRLAANLTDWLLCIQLADGSFTDPTKGLPHIFDTGQILRGLLSSGETNPLALDAARRAADYLCVQMLDSGRGGFGTRYTAGEIPESVHLYVLPALMQAAVQLNTPAYREAAQGCMDYYLSLPDSLDINALTHFLGYEIEALIQLGAIEQATAMMAKVSALQQPDGSVRAKGGVQWVCSTGLAQLAICWYRLGQNEAANRAMGWLDSHQESSGGFFGSYGADATYFPTQQIGWAVKFYLDAHQLRRQDFLKTMPSTSALLQALRTENACDGKQLAWMLPQSLTPIDASIQVASADLELPVSTDTQFEQLFSVDLLSFSTNPTAIIDEMATLSMDGGWLYLLEKTGSKSDSSLPTWAQRPDVKAIEKALHTHCDRVSAKSYGADYTLFSGQKRSRLTGSEWNDVLINDDSKKAILENLRANRTTAWGREMLLKTRVSDRVLEIGSGTGEISLQLARTGRNVTILDISEESLNFTTACADELGVSLQTACGDAMQPLPFPDDAFDCVWNSGLLEHFYATDRQAMLREWSRVTAGTLITLVPNGASLAYRAGKADLERRGKWRYGLEMPLLTMRDDYEAAGLTVTHEYSIGVEHALAFLPAESGLRQGLMDWIRQGLPNDGAHQGYLMVTIGTRRKD